LVTFFLIILALLAKSKEFTASSAFSFKMEALEKLVLNFNKFKFYFLLRD